MSKLWIPEGLSEEAIEVFIDLEYARSKMKPLSHQYQIAVVQSQELSSVISELAGIVRNLKTKRVKIVSLEEFHKVLNSLARAERVQASNKASIQGYSDSIRRLEESIVRMEKQFEKLKREQNGKVLKFNGKKRKR